jgi:hypothetical protein
MVIVRKLYGAPKIVIIVIVLGIGERNVPSFQMKHNWKSSTQLKRTKRLKITMKRCRRSLKLPL